MRTDANLQASGQELARLDHDPDVAVVLTGSWGRAEVTSGSDHDFMMLVAGGRRKRVKPDLLALQCVFDRPPGSQGVFGVPVFSDEIVQNIGLEDDSNSNLTRRMLLMLESVAASNSDILEAARRQVIGRYIDVSVKDSRPPRLLLNDLIRYWRTICVDFAGKEQQDAGKQGARKWGIRNAKLRTSRKMLFAGGLLPVLACATRTRNEMAEYLSEQMRLPPTDRVAQAFLDYDAADAGGRTLRAYDEFIGLLDEGAFRLELQSLTRAEAAGSKHSRKQSGLDVSSSKDCWRCSSRPQA